MSFKVFRVILIIVLVILTANLMFASVPATPCLAATETLRPNAAGDENAIASQEPADSFPATAHWDKVDEAEADEFITYVFTDSEAYERDLYNIADHSVDGTINYITVYMRVQSYDGGPPTGDMRAKIAIKSGTTVAEGDEETETNDSWTNFSYQWTINPHTSSAWTWAEIDSLQIGVAMKCIEDEARCTQVYVVVDYTPPPSVTTNAATNVEETSATLNGEITALNDGNATIRGFEWDIDSGSPYANDWYGEGSFGVEAFDHDITGLTEGELYYYRAYATNSNGTGYGDEVTFLIKPDEPTSFDAVVGGATQVDLTWVKGTGAQKTYIRGKDGSYPTDRTDGYEVYNDTGTNCSDTGLTGGNVYYYRAWSYATEGGKEQYSDLYDQDSVTLSPALKLWYQPNATISGTTLIDRQGDYDGTITWGARLADSGTTTTLVDSELTQADDYWNTYTLKVKETTDHNAPEGESSAITDFTASNDTLTFGALTVAPESGDRYEIWDEEKIIWGSFPEGISVEVGALVAYTTPVSEATGGEDPEVVKAPPLPAGMWGGAASENLPLYPLFVTSAEALDWEPEVLYVVMVFVVGIGMGVAVLLLTGSILGGTVMVAASLFIGTAMEILAFWVIIVYVILAGAWLYVSRSM